MLLVDILGIVHRQLNPGRFCHGPGRGRFWCRRPPSLTRSWTYSASSTAGQIMDVSATARAQPLPAVAGAGAPLLRPARGHPWRRPQPACLLMSLPPPGCGHCWRLRPPPPARSWTSLALSTAEQKIGTKHLPALPPPISISSP